jgi:hypothetical protein
MGSAERIFKPISFDAFWFDLLRQTPAHGVGRTQGVQEVAGDGSFLKF